MFVDRVEAGKKLAQELQDYKDKDCVVVAIPRGGVVVANQVAKELDCPLDLIITRKIGAPGNPELAMGAVAGENRVVINEDVKAGLKASEEYIQTEVAKQLDEIRRRRRIYMGEKPPISLKDRITILVDDGLATGYTARVAIDAIRKEEPSQIVLAVPVAPRDTCLSLSSKVEKVVCLDKPQLFYAVGQFYVDFSQTTDDEVVEIMRKYG